MPGESLVIRYTEAGFICQNYGEAAFEFGNDQATISGKVGCRTDDAHPSERKDAAIEGWFDLDKQDTPASRPIPSLEEQTHEITFVDRRHQPR